MKTKINGGKMVYIDLEMPKMLNKTKVNPLSGFITFNYHPDIVSSIKSLPLRRYDPDRKQWEVPYNQVAKVAEQLSAYDDVEIHGEYLPDVATTALNELPQGFEFKTKPYAHQIDTLLYSMNNDCFLLGDDQGLGKTKQIIDLFRLKRFIGKAKRLLVICCVNGNKYNWNEEVKIHSDLKPWILGTRIGKRSGKPVIGTAQDRLSDLENLPEWVDVVITNVETLRLLPYKDGKSQRYKISEKLRELCAAGEFGVIALDEVHKNKNPNSAQSKGTMRIRDTSMIPMSGTFVLNAPFDMYFPLSWAGLEDHSWYQFQRMYGRYAGNELLGYKNLEVLHEYVEPIMLRRTKDEVLDLPEKIRMVEYVELSKEQRSVYNAVREDIRGEIDKVRVAPDPLSMLIRLRQATGHPGILSTTCSSSAKMERLEELVEDEIVRGGAVLVFSNWTQITDEVQRRLARYSPSIVTGSTTQSKRHPQIVRFQHAETSVCIGTIGALGTGFTLNRATMVIFLDEPWNRGLKDQAEDRAHRIGTKKPVTVITLIAKDTIDERVNDIVEERGEMADLIVDGKMNTQRALNLLLDL